MHFDVAVLGVTVYHQPGTTGCAADLGRVDSFVLQRAVFYHQPVDQFVGGHTDAVLLSILEDAALPFPYDPRKRVRQDTFKEGVIALLSLDLLNFYNKFQVGDCQLKKRISQKMCRLKHWCHLH